MHFVDFFDRGHKHARPLDDLEEEEELCVFRYSVCYKLPHDSTYIQSGEFGSLSDMIEISVSLESWLPLKGIRPGKGVECSFLLVKMLPHACHAHRPREGERCCAKEHM